MCEYVWAGYRAQIAGVWANPGIKWASEDLCLHPVTLGPTHTNILLLPLWFLWGEKEKQINGDDDFFLFLISISYISTIIFI